MRSVDRNLLGSDKMAVAVGVCALWSCALGTSMPAVDQDSDFLASGTLSIDEDSVDTGLDSSTSKNSTSNSSTFSTTGGEEGGSSTSGSEESDSASTTSTTSTSSTTGGEESTSTGDEDSETGSDPKDPFADIEFELHDNVNTIVVVQWNQMVEAEEVWIRYSFENGNWFETPKVKRVVAKQSEVLLGVPEGLEVDFQLIGVADGETNESAMFSMTNGMAPSSLPRPKLKSFDAKLASENRWLLGNTVENKNNENDYDGPNWNYIIDRQARVVWYRRNEGGRNGERTAGFWPRISRDGTHLTMDEQERHKSSNIVRTTLDFSYQETIEIPGFLGDAYDFTKDGSVLYDDRKTTFELRPSGEVKKLWECDLGTGQWDCFSNAINWDEKTDSILLSFSYNSTVVRLERSSGKVLARWGENGDWEFDPSTSGFARNGWPVMTPQGTLLVSSHTPGETNGEFPHLFREYVIDESNQTLEVKWTFGEGTNDWAEKRGLANPVEGGNIIANYGWGGVIVEITPDKEIAWRVEFDVEGSGEDQRGKLLGNTILLNDLYAINRGPKRRTKR